MLKPEKTKKNSKLKDLNLSFVSEDDSEEIIISLYPVDYDSDVDCSEKDLNIE